MILEKYLFIDRDGTLIIEPEDKQIDALEKLQLVAGVIPALLRLKAAGFRLIMISNQDGLGTSQFPESAFYPPHHLLLDIFKTQGIVFDAIHICPHLPSLHCDCRKPKLGLVLPYLVEQKISREHSYVIGDRATDLELAKNMGLKSFCINQHDPNGWHQIAHEILNSSRIGKMTRKTLETDIQINLNLDETNPIHISTGIGFFDHMLEQLAKHGGFSLSIQVTGDLHIDDHHTIEDVGIVLGQALKQALGDKRGINRYGFLLPMDEALTTIALDLSGRSYFKFNGEFKREKVGDLSTELVSHFFRSMSDGLSANLHISVSGENTHHMIEAIFKGVGRTLAQAIKKSGEQLPTTKGVL